MKGVTRITSHLIFGRLGPAFTDSNLTPPLTLTPQSSLYRRTPVFAHPAQGEPFTFRPAITLRETVRICADPRYSQRNKLKIATPNKGENPDMNGVVEYGGLVQFTHENDEVTQVTIPIIADLFRSVRLSFTGIGTHCSCVQTPELLRSHLNSPRTTK